MRPTYKNSLFLVALTALIGGILIVFSIISFKTKETEKAPDYSATLKPERKTIEKEEDVSLIFLGDLMTDRYIRTVLKKNGDEFLLENRLSEKLQNADGVVANLEGPITSLPSKSVGTEAGSPENYSFTMPEKETLAFLEKQNIQTVNLGNNHILNFGKEGLEKTKRSLDNHQINYFGDPEKKDNYLIESFNGLRIAFVNYNQFSENAKARAGKSIEKSQEEADFSILYAHWGDEYSTVSGPDQQSLSRYFIKKGADLIVGSHPHVVQESDIYQGVEIYYSLGNFIFDQYFSPETRKGLLLEAKIQKNGEISLKETNIKLEPSGQTALSKD
ncbi:MAG: CapA family protein [Patescibacteria group bacterium]